MRTAVLIGVATVIAGAAAAQPPSEPKLKYVPVPKSPPDRYYPERAMNAGQSGSAVLRCHFREDGMLTDCAVLSEDPPKFGFGKAALNLAFVHRAKPADLDGSPVAGRTTDVTIRFNLNDAPPPAKP